MIFIKGIGGILIFFISLLIGFQVSKQYSTRVSELKEIKNALNMFKTKIKLTYEPIKDIFLEISKSYTGETKKIFETACENLEKDGAGASWENSIEKCKNINKEDKDVLKTLSKLLGKTDIAGQVSEIDVTSIFLDSQIEKAENERIKNEKLYRALGVIVGLGIIIILM